MSKRKRSAFLLCDEEPDVHILVARATEPISAHFDVLRLYSGCAQDLPRGEGGAPTIWNLRNLLLEGESDPVSPSVVESWLDMVYSHVDTSRRKRTFLRLQEVKPLVLFADAVCTCDAAMRELCDMLVNQTALQLDVPLGEETLQIMLQGRIYYVRDLEGLTSISTTDGSPSAIEAPKAVYALHAKNFTTTLGQQLESWLYLAGRLQMLPLVQLLINFIKTQLLAGCSSPLAAAVGNIYSPRVLQCMPRELLYAGFLRDTLLYRPNDLQLKTIPDGLKVKLVTAEAATALRLYSHSDVLHDLAPGKSIENAHLLHLSNRSRVAKPLHNAPVNVSVGGLNAKLCEKIVQAALDKAIAHE
ncbi:hypothetical protein VOLCADRAFT_90717 [Volvox carteri f. nagariensis]|uniref:Uncharacterized protein n=1 Tax=Volvox carteri f. nagariensis TaxID=3068 RepID=D8TVJ3_VOLCA|nr:uncharacterized protein VOLCADRAFT_90717 [Volvox carteri f. nagariensis]EFJ48467.1 hypothetical protein VOLCADRAFT_90717 [Volvox carteri f. nagariensis]|eukprot:XP_002950266.1 hypothetical protein VOLCADRAFT_90717 [Volvox carteri f. nagariensis]